MKQTRRASDEFNVPVFRTAFLDFLDHVTIVSKDTGRGRIHLFNVQRVMLDQIFDALSKEQHWIVTLKARQLGSTTISLLLDVFWAAMFPGLQGAIVTHDEPSKEKIRLLLDDILVNLPDSHRLPVKRHNRNGILFETPGGDSMIDYLVAGTTNKKGTLGRSRALNFCHMTEVSSYGDEEGFESLKDTFSEVWPFRFYHEESTARGFNLFHDEWEDAGDDTITKRQIFLSWWMHERYRHERGSALFERYGYPQLDEDEQKVSDIVLEQFDHVITVEQWAWYRHRKDPRARGDFQTTREDREEIVEQEYPSYPEQAFIQTGSPFISSTHLTPLSRNAMATKFYGYRYRYGDRVTTTTRDPVDFARMAQLKVYQEPAETGVYIVAGDSAYASSDESDSYCAQVIRCYADKVVQVAEFCVRNMETFQFAWVMLDLCAYYNNCRYVLELNGSGEAVMTEFRHLKTQIEMGALVRPRIDPSNPTEEELQEERNTRNMLSRVRQYLYKRQDSLLGGYNIQMMMSLRLRHSILVQLRDRIVLNQMLINSVECIREVQSLRQDGLMIQPEGKKHDDRAMALAMGVRAWLDQERSNLEAMGRTYAFEHSSDDAPAFNTSNLVVDLMNSDIASKMRGRERRQRFARRPRWGW